jgi:GNAT superfamily N-acetyltransferase
MNAQTPIEPYVRPAIPDDAEGIAKVHVKSWQESYIGMLPQKALDEQSILARYREWAADLGAPIAYRWVYVAVDPKQGIVGFVEARCHVGARIKDYTYEIPVLYVLRSHARRGLGRRLLHSVAGALQAKGDGPILLWALADNVPARAFYEAMGGTLDAVGAEPKIGGNVPLARYRWDGAGDLLSATAP